MNMQMIPLSQIDVGQRLRAIDPDNAAVIAASLQEIGQRQPIEVRNRPAPPPQRRGLTDGAFSWSPDLTLT